MIIYLFKISGFSIAYCVTYRILRKLVNVSPEYDGRILSFIHGLLATYYAFRYVAAPYFGFLDCEYLPTFLDLSQQKLFLLFRYLT